MNSINDWQPGVSILDLIKFRADAITDSDAWVGHIPFANYIVQKVQPKIFVELGVYTGNSYLAFCQSIDHHKIETRAFGVDSWAGDIHMGPQDQSVFTNITRANEKYSSFSTLIRKNFDDAVADFDDKSIDLLHIDGTHTYDAVRNDFKSWLPKLSENATVLFHDTNVIKQDFGVRVFWSEVKQNYPTLEFYHSNGLGVLQMPSVEKDKKLPFGAASEIAQIQSFFEILGQKTQELFERQEVLKDTIARLDLADGKIKTLEQEKALILASLSWRTTSWLRAMARIFRD